MIKLTKYILLSIIALLSFSCNEDKSKDWSVTYNKYSDQPFGCQVFDNVILKCTQLYDTEEIIKFDSIAQLSENQIWQINKLDSHGIELLNTRMEKGFSTIVATENFEPNLIQLSCYEPFSVNKLRADIEDDGSLSNDTIYLNDFLGYSFPSSMCGVRMTDYSFPAGLTFYGIKQLAFIDNAPVALQYTQQNASTIIVTVPLIFTNFGALYYDMAEVDVKIIGELGSKTFKRYYTKRDQYAQIYNTKSKKFGVSEIMPQGENEEGELNIPFLFKLFIIGLFILFLTFYARHRERVIPVIDEPQNRTIDFVRQISLNHYWRKDYREMVCKKYIFFANNIHNKTKINLDDEAHLDENIDIIASSSGVSRDTISELISSVSDIRQKHNEISEATMKSLINTMNNIIQKLK